MRHIDRARRMLDREIMRRDWAARCIAAAETTLKKPPTAFDAQCAAEARARDAELLAGHEFMIELLEEYIRKWERAEEVLPS